MVVYQSKSSVNFTYWSDTLYVCYIVVYGWCSYLSSASSHTPQRIHPVCCTINCSSASFFTANQAVTHSITLRGLCHIMFNKEHGTPQRGASRDHTFRKPNLVPANDNNSTEQSPPEVLLVAQLVKKFPIFY